MVAPLPFKVAKAFTLNGRLVARGEVVDVSMLKVSTVVNMERGNYGIRVAAEQPPQAVARSNGRKHSPRRKPSASAPKE